MARNSNKAYEPFKMLPPGVCPVCHKATMVVDEHDRIISLMDEDGISSNFVVTTERLFVCMNCGFVTDKYIATDKGYRFNPYSDDEFILEKNRTHHETVGVEHTPFMKEEI